MENEPITPHTGPTIDADGRLTYVGEDGRRYVVVDGMELDPESSAEVMEALRSAGALFQEIETLCLGWLDLVSASPLGREEAMTLLLATLETVLEASGEHDSAHDDDGAPATNDSSPTTFNKRSAGTPGLRRATISKARVNNASPARMAIASP